MNKKTQQIEQPSEREFVIARLFDAPRELVWQAWSKCEHLQHWWPPMGWTLPVCKMDFRPGGVWHYCMKGPGPDGNEAESWGRMLFREIEPPERFIAVDAFSDEAGNVAEDMPEMVFTVTFVEVDQQTRVTSRIEFATAADLQTVLQMGMEEGMGQSWDQLAAHLAQIQP